MSATLKITQEVCNENENKSGKQKRRMIELHTDDLMFLLVENLLWKDLAGSVSPSLSEESPSPPADEVGTGLVETFVSLAAMR